MKRITSCLVRGIGSGKCQNRVVNTLRGFSREGRLSSGAAAAALALACAGQEDTVSIAAEPTQLEVSPCDPYPSEVPSETGSASTAVTDAGPMPERPHRLLQIDPTVRPYKVSIPWQCVGNGEQYQAKVLICVSEQGTVSSVTVQRRTIPFIDEQLPVVIGRWTYDPYLVDGEPMPFCYPLLYTIR